MMRNSLFSKRMINQTITHFFTFLVPRFRFAGDGRVLDEQERKLPQGQGDQQHHEQQRLRESAFPLFCIILRYILCSM